MDVRKQTWHVGREQCINSCLIQGRTPLGFFSPPLDFCLLLPISAHFCRFLPWISLTNPWIFSTIYTLLRTLVGCAMRSGLIGGRRFWLELNDLGVDNEDLRLVGSLCEPGHVGLQSSKVSPPGYESRGRLLVC